MGNGTSRAYIFSKTHSPTQQTDAAFLNWISIPLDIPPEELRAEWDMMIKYFGLDVYMCPTGEDEDDEWLGSTVVL